MTTQIDPKIYQAAHETAVFTPRPLGILKIQGETRLDLIDRMSTQSVKNLASGEGAATILTTDIGRIIDRLILYASSDTAYALTSENNSDAIARYLMRFVFFNDDFRMEDVSAETAVFAIYGPQSQTKLAKAGFPEADLPLHHWRQANINGTTLYLHRTDPIAGDGYFVMCQQSDADTAEKLLIDAGIIKANEAAFDALRIESGLPRFNTEMTRDYIPLETNLWNDVSFNKGCYIGQEIIARMESRGKLAKKLVPLKLSTPVEPGAELTANGKSVGTITSVAMLPTGPIGLGYVKTAVLNSESELMVGETAVTVKEIGK
ncbi:MAG: folate-binding protein [Chloroflexi bacterium]|nr:MAG: folate-binding protein [Chloroflexota bacterium]